MTKHELVQRIARRPGLPAELKRRDVSVLVDAVFAELADYLIEAKVSKRQAARFTFPGFGTFTKKRRGERGGRNPQTGEPITIPANTTVGFQPGSELKAALNRDGTRRRKTG